MADKIDRLKNTGTDSVNTQDIGFKVYELVNFAKNQRRSFERRWYDNNFFDDGFHYRFLQRTTNKIIDLSERASVYNPMRAIPKASRQLRGIVNLLVSNDPHPVIFPEDVSKQAYTSPEELQAAKDAAKNVAKKTGFWIENEFQHQLLIEKIAEMLLLAGKHSVSYMQIWPDAVKEQIRTQVYDAFDIYLFASLTDIEDSPFLIKGVPRLISQIKADERFDKEQVNKISVDNRQASSEIKEAYLSTRFGKRSNPDNSATLIQSEAFLKEYLNSENRMRIQAQDNAEKILKDRKDGDLVIRQVFAAGNIWLRDRYVSLKEYPFVDYRYEPGPIYQVPMIERFIPQNKSLDAAVSRVEKYLHTMVAGTWLKRQGEQFQITNDSGGQVIEYSTTPPTQAAIQPVPPFVFEFMNFLSNSIEEQGVTTTSLAKIPKGVRSNAAIESLKESEFASLTVPSRRLQETIKKIIKKFLDIADEYFITPKEVAYLDRGKPDFFSVMGSKAMKGRKSLKVDNPEGVIPLKSSPFVDVEIQSGMAFTREGRRVKSKELLDSILLYAKEGFLPPEAIRIVLEKYLENYQFGATAEFMESMDDFLGQGGTSPKQNEGVKVALAEVFRDLIKEGIIPDQETRIQEQKIATAEVLRDTQGSKEQPAETAKSPSESISFKDLPKEGKVQMAAQAGIQLSPEQIAAQEATQKVSMTNKGGGE